MTDKYLPTVITTNNTGNSYYADAAEDVIANDLAVSLRQEMDKRMVLIIKLNLMSDEKLIQELLKDKEVYDLLVDPSDTVKEAYKFKYEL